MNPCHHITGHKTTAHGALCLAVRRAQPLRHYRPEWVGGIDGIRLLVRAYEAETDGDAARVIEATRELEAFIAAATAVIDGARPAKPKVGRSRR